MQWQPHTHSWWGELRDIVVGRLPSFIANPLGKSLIANNSLIINLKQHPRIQQQQQQLAPRITMNSIRRLICSCLHRSTERNTVQLRKPTRENNSYSRVTPVALGPFFAVADIIECAQLFVPCEMVQAAATATVA